MKEDRQHRFTAKIADVEPFVFTVSEAEEPIFRRAVYYVNDVYRSMQRNQPGRTSHYILARVALAFAELYYRKAEQLQKQTELLEDFEKELDDILLTLD